MFTLGVILAVSLLELSIWLPGLWRLRKGIAFVDAFLLCTFSGAWLSLSPSVWSGLMLLLSIYRVFNLARVLEGRLSQRYLYGATLRTSLSIIGGQLLLVGVWKGFERLNGNSVWWVVGGFQLVVAIILAVATERNIRATKPPKHIKPADEKHLPTLTVAIPARNETHSLEECLRTVLADNYPKLEVLVYDDCSQNKRTPEIIRGFAHDGVVFIQGVDPSGDWLAKNFAYNRLYEEANGELILFCGVDVRFKPGSLRRIVETLLEQDKNMLSIMPRNVKPATIGQLDALLVQPMRYAWELALPRGLFKRPPVLSTCWIARRSFIKTAGGFGAVRQMITPESYFARESASENDSYSFLRSSPEIEVSSIKGYADQRDTAMRTRYPQLHKKPEQVCLLTLAQAFFLIAPFAVLIALIIKSHVILSLLSGLSCTLLIFFYARIIYMTYRSFMVGSLLVLPLAALSNIAMTHYSMWKYEFSEVIWKGRNICVPLYEVIPALPKIENREV